MREENKIRAIRGAVFILFALLTAFAAAGCGGSAPSPAPAASGKHTYHLEGTIVSVDKAKQSVVVDAKEIPGFMSAMAMPYPVATVDSQMLDKLGPGDQITADVLTDDSGFSLQNIVIVKKGNGAKTAPAAFSQPPAGETAPDLTLLNQDGKRIDLRQYSGKALLITFIYTRCPLPDYCPLMTHNFASIEKSLSQSPALFAETHLLSISFDPQFDTPAVLRSYARTYGQSKFDHWEFASLPAGETRDATSFFNIFVSAQDGQINHSMATAILTPQGALYRIYSGNDWKPADVLADLAGAANQQAPQRTEAAAAH